MKKYVIRDRNSGKFLRGRSCIFKLVDDLEDARVYSSKSAASNSRNYGRSEKLDLEILKISIKLDESV